MTLRSVSLDISGLAEAKGFCDEIGSVDLSKPMRQVSLVMRDKVVETFRDAHDPWHQPWPPLQQATLDKRAARGNTRTSILVDSGRMYDSIDNASDATSATVSMDSPAEFHLDGTSRMPPRPMFPDDDPPDDWWSAVAQPILGELDDAARRK